MIFGADASPTRATEWLEANYFHRAEDNDWQARLGELLGVRAAGQLPGRLRSNGSLRRRMRRRLRLVIPDGSVAT